MLLLLLAVASAVEGVGVAEAEVVGEAGMLPDHRVIRTLLLRRGGRKRIRVAVQITIVEIRGRGRWLEVDLLDSRHALYNPIGLDMRLW